MDDSIWVVFSIRSLTVIVLQTLLVTALACAFLKVSRLYKYPFAVGVAPGVITALLGLLGAPNPVPWRYLGEFIIFPAMLTPFSTWLVFRRSKPTPTVEAPHKSNTAEL